MRFLLVRMSAEKVAYSSTWRDLAMLLLTFPELKSEEGAVSQALKAIGANDDVIQTWGEFVAADLRGSAEDSEFD